MAGAFYKKLGKRARLRVRFGCSSSNIARGHSEVRSYKPWMARLVEVKVVELRHCCAKKNTSSRSLR